MSTISHPYARQCVPGTTLDERDLVARIIAAAVD